MKKIIIAIASVIILCSCLTPSAWLDDYSTVSCEVTWPNAELDKMIFISSYDEYKPTYDIYGQTVWENDLNGYIYDNCFRYYRFLRSEDTKYWRLTLGFHINLYDSTIAETPTIDHQYKITSPDLTVIDKNDCVIEDIEFIDGYVIFTKCEKYLGYLRLSGKFEIICDKLTITNGTFIDILCEDHLGEILESDEDIVDSIRIDFY